MLARMACVAWSPEKVERHVLLVAEHPAVVAARDAEEISGSHRQLGSVVHLDRDATAHHQPDVLDLTQRGTGERSDMFGPAPTWCVDGAADLLPAHGEKLEATEWEAPLFPWL